MYCTYLTIYNGSLMPKRYIGSTSLERLTKGYNGTVTSKLYRDVYKSEQRNNKHLFKTRILSRFETREEALAEEQRLHVKFNVVKDPRYINQKMAIKESVIVRLVGEDNPMFGVERPSEWREEHSKFMMGNDYACGEWSKERKKEHKKRAKERAKIKCSCLLCFQEITYFNIKQHYGSTQCKKKLEEIPAS